VKIDSVGLGLINLDFSDNDIAEMFKYVDDFSIPLDGSTDEIIKKFRHSEKNLKTETTKVMELFNKKEIRYNVNTVVHRGNLSDAMGIAKIILNNPMIKKWQIFQYMPIGPKGFNNRKWYEITDDEFRDFCVKIESTLRQRNNDYHLEVEFLDKASRKKKYLFVDTEGNVWRPDFSIGEKWIESDSNSNRVIIDNISTIAGCKRITNLLDVSSDEYYL
jgi:MoaA/NifB/PqqE/SkfB family radical SAM enzyme